MAVKITDIAKRAGVAPSTVSNALSGKKFVNPKLKSKIIQICEDMNYQPNFYASSLQRGKTNIIGLFLEKQDEFEVFTYYNKMIPTCIIEAEKQGYHILIYYEASESKIVSLLNHGSAPIDGAIILTPSIRADKLTHIESNRIPCVLIGHPADNLNLHFVDINNEHLAYSVTNTLLKKYRKVYLFNSDEKYFFSNDWKKGFSNAINDNGLTFSEDLIVPINSLTQKEAYDKSINLLDVGIAFLTANETIAKGIYQATIDSEMSLGIDIGVFALSYIKETEDIPSLSHAKVNAAEIAKVAVTSLIKYMDKDEEMENVLISPDIIHKKSSIRNDRDK